MRLPFAQCAGLHLRPDGGPVAGFNGGGIEQATNTISLYLHGSVCLSPSGNPAFALGGGRQGIKSGAKAKASGASCSCLAVAIVNDRNFVMLIAIPFPYR